MQEDSVVQQRLNSFHLLSVLLEWRMQLLHLKTCMKNTIQVIWQPVLIVRFNVIVESQPLAFAPARVTVYVPEVVYVVLFSVQTYEPQATSVTEDEVG